MGDGLGFAFLDQLLRTVYPPACLSCRVLVEDEFGLCGTCWRDTPFVTGLACDLCGVALPGEATGEPVHCDECLQIARPWQRGRAALMYRDNARRLVLALKHGDRHDIVHPAARWMARAGRELVTPGMVVAPVPLHWRRMLTRRFNQSALLAGAVSQDLGLQSIPDLLVRCRATPALKGLGRDQRFRALEGAIKVRPARAHQLRGRDVMLVDDVMTSGATLAAATLACQKAGAENVHTLVLARAGRDV